MNCRISVRGLRTETKINDIFEIFQDFGTITSCRLITDKRNESKGYCFISYSQPEEAVNALHSMNGKRFDGAQLNIVYATVQNEMKFDDPELQGVKMPPSKPKVYDPPTPNNWERHFNNASPTNSSIDEYDFQNNIQDKGQYNVPPPLPSPSQIPSANVSQSQIPPPLIPPPPPGFTQQKMIPPPPPSLISQPKMGSRPPPPPPPPPPPLSLISQSKQQPSQLQQIPIRSNYQPPPPPLPSSSSPGPPQALSSSNPSRSHIQYQQSPQPQPRSPYRSHDYNNYGPPDEYSYEQEFQREHQFRTSGGASSRIDDSPRYQYYAPQDSRYPPQDTRYPPQDSRYPPHPSQRPPPPNYGRPPPPPPHMAPPPPHMAPPSHRPPPPMQQRVYQGHRQDRQPPPPHMPPPHSNQQHDLYFESD